MIKTLVMEQFQPYRARVELPLDNQGLVLIRGDNKVSAALNDNGSGKTSIAHAISWVLFGEDLAGRRADAVACRFTEGQCVVRLDLEDDLGAWSVLRTRRPHGLSVEGIPGIAENEDMALIQEKIESRLGFGLRTFRNAVIFGQGTFDRFAHADQAEQMRMLDEIQGVDFREAAKRCKEWRDQLNAQFQGSPLARINQDLLAVEGKIATLTRLRNEYEVDKYNRLQALTVRITQAHTNLREADEQNAAVKRDLPKLEPLRQAMALVSYEERGHRDLLHEEQTADHTQGVSGSLLADLLERLNKLTETGECAYCRAPSKGVRTRFKKDLDAATKRHQQDQLVHKKASRACAEQLAKIVIAQDALKVLLPTPTTDPTKYLGWLEQRCSAVAIKSAESTVAKRRDELAALQTEHRTLELKVWDGQGELAQAAERKNTLAGEAERELVRVNKIQAALVIAEYWQEAFSDRGIRSLLVDSVADYINQRMALHLDKLAAGEARSIMSAQTALKKGGAKERISFATSWDWGTAQGPGSGGQDQRVLLAQFAAVQDLAEARSARPFPLKIYDEPFDALDSRGKELACEWIRAQVKTYGTVLLITHSDEIAAMVDADQTWTVVHDQDGARVKR